LQDAVAEAEAALVATAAAQKEAEVVLVAADADVKDLTIVAPVSGVVTSRAVNPGEQVAGGQLLFEIVDLNSLYLKVFLSGPDMGRISVGADSRLYTDAFPEKPVAATVRTIASNAEFTPKDVATPDERVKLVYAIKIYLTENPEQRVKPGMPADAVIRWKDGVEWIKPTW
jgi:HlyD family secretion protein